MRAYPKLHQKAMLSPMAGVNDLAFRQLCEQEGAALAFTEMLPAASISRRPEFLPRYFQTCPAEQRSKRLGVQLMASTEHEAVAAAKKFDGVARVIDLNVGCPSHSIRKSGAGSALLSDEARLLGIVHALADAVKVPVSVKIRLGETTETMHPLELAKRLEEAGASAIGVHARTVAQGYSGKANWGMIKQIKDAVSVPIIGNGDVTSPEKAKRMLDDTGCDYVMVGRGALGKPYIFSQINDFLSTGKYRTPTPQEHIEYFFRYLELAKRLGLSFSNIKTQAMYFTTGLPHAPRLRNAITHCKTTEQLEHAYRTHRAGIAAGESLNTDEIAS